MKKRFPCGKGMRLAFTLIAMLALTMTGAAQKPYEYDECHKYLFGSNWHIGPVGQFSFYHGKTSVGIGGIATKRLDDYVYFRAEAAVNGLKAVEGFNRYGTAFAGFQFNFVNWAYAFAEGGAVIDPTMPQKAGLGASGGIGLTCDFGKYSGLLGEGGCNFVQNGVGIDNMFYARIGYFVRPGILKKDKVAIDIDNHIRTTYGELKTENQLLKSEAKKKDEDNAKLQDLLERSTAALEIANQRYNNCQAEVQQVTDNCGKAALIPIRFDYASAQIPYWEISNVEYIANYIKTNEGNYKIEGYSSPDGNDYNNQKLSGDRAFSVYQMLTEVFGISKDRLIPMANGVTTQYGEDSELNRCVIVSKSKY